MKSEKRTTVYFEASSADRLCELLGAYDENLKTLSAELGVEISVADGLTLKISGEKENVVLCEKALKAAAGAAEAEAAHRKNPAISKETMVLQLIAFSSF